MRKGFTMIELIFVIVILGILAAVAIPRLAATRDDAEIAKVGTNITTLMSDIGAYYTSQAELADTLNKMSNVQVAGGNTGLTGNIMTAGKACIKVTVTDADAATKKPAFMKVEKGDGSTEKICGKVYDLASIKALLKGTFQWQVPQADGSYDTQTSGEGEIAVSGSGVKF
jgi:prokaryotic N-methylation motif domain protein